MEKIKKTISQIFFYIDNDIKIDFSFKEDDAVLFIDVKMKEPQILIGEKGQTLSEIERVIKIIIKKNTEKNIFINLDINDYKKRKADYLISLADEIADEVFFSGIEKSFPPMAAFERRIIHMAVKDRDGVFSESIGEGEDRRIVIRKK